VSTKAGEDQTTKESGKGNGKKKNEDWSLLKEADEILSYSRMKKWKDKYRIDDMMYFSLRMQLLKALSGGWLLPFIVEKFQLGNSR
jgi:hypothetical protein